ncbi:MAG: hypothetical protein Q9227_004090 [Pyrenula ochraceoflavens]
MSISESSDKTPTYTFAHARSITAAHAERTAAKNAAFLLPHLKPTYRILDVGCGPGSITADFASLVPQGSVVGLDISPSVLDQARDYASKRGLSNVEFVEGNVLKGLPFGDDEFDVVFTHMVLVHNSAPVQALREMKRVTKPGGMVACREGDTHQWWPELPGMSTFNKMVLKTTLAGGAVAPFTAGRQLGAWAREAGFEADTGDGSKLWRGASWESKILGNDRKALADFWVNFVGGQESGYREKVKMAGFTDAEIEEGVTGMREWADHPDAWYAHAIGEMIAWV